MVDALVDHQDLPDDPFDKGSEETWTVAEHLARTLRVRGSDVEELVSAVATEAVRTVPAARDCGVILTSPSGAPGGRGDRYLRTVAATGDAPHALDDLQARRGSGPCITAARKQITVRVHDIAADDRWPEFRAEALRLGVASMLCLPLYVDDSVLGALSFYSDEPDAFREGAEPAAGLVAALAAVALADAHHSANLRRAMASRDLIGQAKGILMHAGGITADEAFDLLRKHSQQANVKLVEVASRVVETGLLDVGS